MKTTIRIATIMMIAVIIATSCSDNFSRIRGEGPVVERTLELENFTALEITGIDNVTLSYGTVQEVVVEGHGNIIDRIQTAVYDDTWFIELEQGNYGSYELTYHITLPEISSVINTGTGNVTVLDTIYSPSFNLELLGSGNFYGYPLVAGNCTLAITGTGDCEITVEDEFDISIEGTGHVYYKGYPSINQNITGTGSIQSMN